jgi:hypothetical protein
MSGEIAQQAQHRHCNNHLLPKKTTKIEIEFETSEKTGPNLSDCQFAVCFIRLVSFLPGAVVRFRVVDT